jgi:hypothetical protein
MSSSSNTACCPTNVLPVVNNYRGKGTMLPAGTLADFPTMTMYQSPTSESASITGAIVVFYDIFGHSVGSS